MKKLYNNIIFYLVCIYIIFLPFSFSIVKIKEQEINADSIFVIIVLVYLFKLITNRTTRQKFIAGIKDFFKNPLSVCMILLCIIMFYSISYSLIEERRLALSESIRFLTYIILYFIIKYELNNREYYTKFLSCIIPLILFQTILGIIQGTTGKFLDEKFIYDTSEFISRYRITGTFDNPNAYGTFLIFFSFPIIMLILYVNNKNEKIFLSSVLILILVNIIMTFSRNAWLAFGIGILMLIIFYRRKIIWLLVGMGIFGAFVPKINLYLREVLTHSRDDNRIKLWKIAGKIIKDYPLKGIGNGNFIAYYDIYAKKYPELWCIDHWRYPVHNSYLKIFSELGIIGFIPFIGMIVSIVSMFRNLYVKLNKNKIILGFTISVIVFLIMNLFDNLLFVRNLTGYFWITIAVMQGLLYLNKNKGGNR